MKNEWDSWIRGGFLTFMLYSLGLGHTPVLLGIKVELNNPLQGTLSMEL